MTILNRMGQTRDRLDFGFRRYACSNSDGDDEPVDEQVFRPICSFATVSRIGLKFYFRITLRPYVRSIQGLHQRDQRAILHQIDPPRSQAVDMDFRKKIQDGDR